MNFSMSYIACRLEIAASRTKRIPVSACRRVAKVAWKRKYVWESSQRNPAQSSRLRKKYFLRRRITSAVKADDENKRVTAALKRCATQNQVQR
jgi:hypothetical protein